MRNECLDSSERCCACGGHVGDFECSVKLNRAGVPVPSNYYTGLLVCMSCADDFAADETAAAVEVL